MALLQVFWSVSLGLSLKLTIPSIERDGNKIRETINGRKTKRSETSDGGRTALTGQNWKRLSKLS